MTQLLFEQLDQTSRTPLLTHGSAALSTSAPHWVFLHQDTPYSDPQEEALPEEEVAEDSQEEEILEEEAADSQAVEDPYKVIRKEDHQGTDL